MRTPMQPPSQAETRLNIAITSKSSPALSRRNFLKQSALWSLRAAALGVGGVGYVRDVEPAWVEVSRLRVGMPSLPDAFGGYKVVQISDIHMGDWMDRAHMQDVVNIANALKPDLIALTGDFVTSQASRHAEDLYATLGQLRASDGVLAVLGNHDQGRNAPVVRRVLASCGIKELFNDVQVLERGGARLYLAGVGDAWVRVDDMAALRRKLPPEGCAILLAHEPDYADTSAAENRFSLQLSGHSHGGQVVLPFSEPSRLPPLGRKYPSGAYLVGDMLLYTNRGVGMVRPHLRFNCRPEITQYTLEPGPLHIG